jgi:hypothetical protein
VLASATNNQRRDTCLLRWAPSPPPRGHHSRSSWNGGKASKGHGLAWGEWCGDLLHAKESVDSPTNRGARFRVSKFNPDCLLSLKASVALATRFPCNSATHLALLSFRPYWTC